MPEVNCITCGITMTNVSSCKKYCGYCAIEREKERNKKYALKWGVWQYRAASAVAKAKRDGVILDLRKHKVKCVDCGERALQYDHRDYLKPLDVDPVCVRCNKLRGPAKPIPPEKLRRPLQ